MATMKEVADLAGVSTAAVSHVVNGTKKLSPETTERILKAIREANYVPNTLAKSLRSGRTHTVGVLVEDIRGMPVPDIVGGVAETLSQNGYRMLLYDLHLLERLYNQYEQISAYRDRINAGAQALLQAQVDGIVYVAMHDRCLDDIFDPIDCPLLFAYSHGTQTDTCVSYSNYESAIDLTRRLLGRGHKRIAVIAGHPHSYPTIRRLAGFKAAMEEAGLEIREDYIRFGDWEYESGVRCANELLALSDVPTAVFAMNDLMAAGCIQAICDKGLRVPGNIAVAGFDNREIARYLRPKLTTVALPTTQIGIRAAKHMLAMIANPALPAEREIVPCSIIERDSV